jgi:hypothetical protein
MAGAAKDLPPAKAPPPTKAVTPTPATAPKPAAGGPGLSAHSAKKDGPDDEAVAPDVIELQGQDEFKVPEPVAEKINKAKGSLINVRFGTLGSGQIRVRRLSDDPKTKAHQFETTETQAVAITHPFLAPIASIEPVLGVKIHHNQISGHLTIRKALHSEDALNRLLADHGAELGLLGFKLPTVNFENKLDHGNLIFGTKAPVTFMLAGWLSGGLELQLKNDHIDKVEAKAHVAVNGLGEGDLLVRRDDKGVYSGELDVSVVFKRFSGNVKAKYTAGIVDVRGTVKYTSEKFSGEVTIIVCDFAEADKMAKAELPPGSVVDSFAKEDPPEKAQSAPKKGARGVAGWGDLAFHFTDWMTGTAKVVIGPAGYLTVVGKIAPPKTLELMPEKVWNQRLFGVDVTARYGLPYVADIHVGISAELGATARIGPAIFTDMSVEGVYSTDPKVLQSFAITGAFRLSAYAGLNLRFEGKAGLTILGHDIDAGIGITGKAGVKGYAEARPTIGYREKADPTADKKGEYYLKGHLELAAQPFLGLSGDLFVKLDSPWWSPAPDKTWTWDLFSLEWPLPGEFGIAADVDYVIGSGKFPDIQFGKASFDSSKFTDSLMDDQIPKKKQGGEAEKAAGWKAEAPKPPTAPPTTASKPSAGPGKDAPTKGTPVTKGGKKGHTPEEAANIPKTADSSKRWLEGMQALAALHDFAEKDPEDDAEILRDLEKIKRQFGFSKLEPHAEGDVWSIDAALNSSKKNAARVKRVKPGATQTKATAKPSTSAASPTEPRLHFTSIMSRPSFRPSTKEAVKITKGEDRRHTDAWQAIHENLKLTLNGMTYSEAFNHLATRVPPDGGPKGKYTPTAATEAAIKEAAKNLLRDMFNHEANLWPGPAPENQEKGREFARAKVKVDDAIERGDRVEFERNIAILEALWHDPDPSGAKAGFTNLVNETVRLLRKQFSERNPGK